MLQGNTSSAISNIINMHLLKTAFFLTEHAQNTFQITWNDPATNWQWWASCLWIVMSLLGPTSSLSSSDIWEPLELGPRTLSVLSSRSHEWNPTKDKFRWYMAISLPMTQSTNTVTLIICTILTFKSFLHAVEQIEFSHSGKEWSYVQCTTCSLHSALSTTSCMTVAFACNECFAPSTSQPNEKNKWNLELCGVALSQSLRHACVCRRPLLRKSSSLQNFLLLVGRGVSERQFADNTTLCKQICVRIRRELVPFHFRQLRFPQTSSLSVLRFACLLLEGLHIKTACIHPLAADCNKNR